MATFKNSSFKKLAAMLCRGSFLLPSIALARIYLTTAIFRGFLRRSPQWAIPLFGLLFAACLETPNAPRISADTPTIAVCAEQNGRLFQETLQLSPSDSFTLKASSIPDSFQQKLRFLWQSASREILHEGSDFSTDTSRVPDSLVALDRYGNRLSKPLHFVFDTAPKLSARTVPAENDTLRGNRSTAFRFAYSATDPDPGDTLFYTVFIDSSRYDVGALTEFFQSGFSPGEHFFQVFAKDLYGLSDSTPPIRFLVAEDER